MKFLATLLAALLATYSLADDELPWRIGAGVIAQERVYNDQEATSFPLALPNDAADILVVPIIGYQKDNWSIGTDGANIEFANDEQSLTFSADIGAVTASYQRSFGWFNIGPELAITYGSGFGWQAGLSSTLLSVSYNSLFEDSNAYSIGISSGAPLYLKEGGPGFIAIAGLNIDSQPFTAKTIDAPFDVNQLEDYQRTLDLGLLHFWQLSEQLDYVIIAQQTWLPEDLKQQAKRGQQFSFISFLTYRF